MRDGIGGPNLTFEGDPGDEHVDFKPWPREFVQAVTQKVPLRTFETGATRDTEDGKLDFEGFLSPLVIRRFGEYMHAHRVQSDGTVRDSDNWQKGIPFDAYMKSGWRHFFDWWAMHRWDPENVEDTEFLEASICALLFNAQGYLHELLAGKVKT
jgi:hypothetical protein